jgi:hypothetical protein
MDIDQYVGQHTEGNHTELYGDVNDYLAGHDVPIPIVGPCPADEPHGYTDGCFKGWAMFHVISAEGGSHKTITGYFTGEFIGSPLVGRQLHRGSAGRGHVRGHPDEHESRQLHRLSFGLRALAVRSPVRAAVGERSLGFEQIRGYTRAGGEPPGSRTSFGSLGLGLLALLPDQVTRVDRDDRARRGGDDRSEREREAEHPADQGAEHPPRVEPEDGG